MSESELYKEGGTIRTSNINKRNEQDAEELRALKSQDRDNAIREEGFREGFEDFERRIASSNQWAPVVEGSPQDIQMQESTNEGINYQEPDEPSLIDSISNRLGKASDNLSEWFNRKPEPEVEQPQSAFLKGQEFDHIQRESEQAGLEELRQILKQQGQ